MRYSRQEEEEVKLQLQDASLGEEFSLVRKLLHYFFRYSDLARGTEFFEALLGTTLGWVGVFEGGRTEHRVSQSTGGYQS